MYECCNDWQSFTKKTVQMLRMLEGVVKREGKEKDRERDAGAKAGVYKPEGLLTKSATANHASPALPLTGCVIKFIKYIFLPDFI